MFRSLVVVLSCAVLLAACATAAAPQLSAEQFEARYPAAADTLAAGDVIRLSLYGDDAFTNEYQVGTDGTVSLPLIGAVPLAGLSLEAARSKIEAGLRDGFYPDARVSAQLVSQSPIYVLGEVARPGSFPFVADLTLSKAAALAGGYTPFASMSVVAVRRAGTDAEVLVQADQSLKLAPGDTVRILSRSL